ncbi:bifunctional diaminohydroxyphosphoribosylaminopyrimidine deaminase/5-amino-6-(5-phosphoribosylamino)uracil reductase RibD [Colwelliaceae bacterium 6471]
MQRAISLAKRGHFTTSPNPRVGCVLVKNNQIVGEGYHIKAGDGHAEVNALRMAGDQAAGATAYVTLEPCSHHGRTPPCAQALINANVAQVIAAMEDPNPQVSGQGMKMLKAAGIATKTGLLENDARTLNVGFIMLMTKKRPFVRCKLASSLDGKTAMASGESKWITSAAARRDVQRLRAQSCAIIAGADSIIMDQAKMTVRWSELGQPQEDYAEQDIRQPVRVIIDSRNRLTPDLAVFQYDSPIILIRSTIENLLTWPHFVEQVQVPLKTTVDGQDKTDLHALLALLGARGINDVLVESGATLAGAFFSENLVDELILYQAPMLLGAEGKSLVNMPDVTLLAQAKQLKINDIRMVGSDVRITAAARES